VTDLSQLTGKRNLKAEGVFLEQPAQLDAQALEPVAQRRLAGGRALVGHPGHEARLRERDHQRGVPDHA